LSIYVNAVYNHPEQHTGNTIFLATVFFSFQIYCDFSGYSDIAIGAANIMGFKLMTNFNRPYFSKNVSEFWKRWHISLSTWFKDYLYFPMGGNRVSKSRLFFNLFTVFLLSGLWHGANWTYIVWGALNGFYLIFAIISEKFRTEISSKLGLFNFPTLNKSIQITITFILVSFAWIFFRANNISDAFILVKKLLTNRGPIFFTSPSETIYSILGVVILISVEAKKEFYSGTFSFLNNPNWIIRNLTYLTIVILILLFGVFDGGQFIYFQF
jgi:D-alanyl-lipoteichoic acid acyltransferase DltB (MBOAT superfamily)